MLDWRRVQDLKDDLGEEDFEEIVGLFLEEVEEKLQGLLHGNIEELSSDLHFLKGSAANLGFESFRKLCETSERDPTEFEAGLLLSEYQESKVAFLAGPDA
ncbi:Hpt domain-containing protein [uncultured Litoreibacter sp.]|uniref:Hpt domain-containing protein n=1 Tax=uncultured Litoreibacter sp. TaxID=1392394 RepID=UPI00260A8509|nr:Hpt domain-containing protein [uncultured Litoreibacter sp.]